MSEPEPLRFGVPQRSVLGPVLFVFYTSSLADLLEAHDVSYHFYADDTQIYIEVSDILDVEEIILSLLHDIKIWMLRRKLKLNDGKTEVVIMKGGLRSNLVAVDRMSVLAPTIFPCSRGESASICVITLDCSHPFYLFFSFFVRSLYN